MPEMETDQITATARFHFVTNEENELLTQFSSVTIKERET